MTMTAPPRLVKGDTVAVIATARVVDRETVNSGIEILKDWGLKVQTGSALFKNHHLFAGSDLERLGDLQQVLDNRQIKAIICARGGYGTTRILDQLDWTGFKKNPKWVCGFSDVTSLLCQINLLGFVCFHSTMPQLFTGQYRRQDLDSLHQALFSHVDTLEASPLPVNQPGTARGMVVGGNLSLLVNQIGTNSDLDTDGCILMLEEVDEYLYHLDRMMVQLKRCGKLEGLAGLVVGHLTKMKEGDLKFGMDAMGIIRSHIDHLNIPAGFGFPFGHQSPNLAVPFGSTGMLTVSSEGSRLQLEY